jgi:hypothetical protein
MVIFYHIVTNKCKKPIFKAFRNFQSKFVEQCFKFVSHPKRRKSRLEEKMFDV